MGRSLSDEALADFEAAVDWYLDALAFTAAEDFANEVEQTARLLESFPNAGTVSTHKTRVFTLANFLIGWFTAPNPTTSAPLRLRINVANRDFGGIGCRSMWQRQSGNAQRRILGHAALACRPPQ